MADLVIVSSVGAEIARIPIEPVTPGLSYAGMRYVEQVRWLTSDRVSVSGSLNPSQSQYYVIDIACGQIVTEFIDDGSSAAFSPDGVHVAIEVGSPHFTSADRRIASLSIDGLRVFPLTPRRGLQFAAPPSWSPDGQSVGAVVQDAQRTTSSLIVWHDGAVPEHVIDLGASQDISLFWSGAQWMVTAAASGGRSGRAWTADAQGLAISSIPWGKIISPLSDARRHREALVAGTIPSAMSQPDFWCARGDLLTLPRSSDPSR